MTFWEWIGALMVLVPLGGLSLLALIGAVLDLGWKPVLGFVLFIIWICVGAALYSGARW